MRTERADLLALPKLNSPHENETVYFKGDGSQGGLDLALVAGSAHTGFVDSVPVARLHLITGHSVQERSN
jgi:hypothetical protein